MNVRLDIKRRRRPARTAQLVGNYKGAIMVGDQRIELTGNFDIILQNVTNEPIPTHALIEDEIRRGLDIRIDFVEFDE